MTELELLARSFAEQLFDQAGEKKVAYVIIVGDGEGIGSAGNTPRDLVVAMCELYLERVARLEKAGIQEQRSTVPDHETKH